jgi:hypothetical protein
MFEIRNQLKETVSDLGHATSVFISGRGIISFLTLGLNDLDWIKKRMKTRKERSYKVRKVEGNAK